MINTWSQMQDKINQLAEAGVIKKGGLKRISDLPEEKRCMDKEHNPPQNYCYKNGVYEYTCPSCGHVQTFTVNNSSF